MTNLHKIHRPPRGVILISVLWVIFILALIAWGLSRRSSMEVSLLETYQGQMRSYAAARAGLSTVLNYLEKSPAAKDTLYSPGIDIDKQYTPEQIFGHIKVSDSTYAKVVRPMKGYTNDVNNHWAYGLEDEDGKININAIGQTNYEILSSYFQIKGVNQELAKTLAQNIVNYKTSPQSSELNGISQERTMLKPKGQGFEHILELLEIDGMTRDIFDKVKDGLTVYSDAQETSFAVNVNTASNAVIEALANYTVKDNAQIDKGAILRQAYDLRDGEDLTPFTIDDGKKDGNLQFMGSLKSSFFHCHVIGVDEPTGARSVIDVYIFRPASGAAQIKGWQRE